jgi:hypothetical protein
MVARSATQLPAGAGWAFEPKADGFLTELQASGLRGLYLLHGVGEGMRLFSRGGATVEPNAVATRGEAAGVGCHLLQSSGIARTALWVQPPDLGVGS